ncbi:MAG: phosphodiesterase [Lachnospiraceae bacterium]|jgi:putative phosphoesterase|nr:phosphodiesterase [Lachnospiraceae bacterium]
MKLMIASDIHGSAYYCRELLEAWKREKPEKLVLLGDILYHGPRNDLPREYGPKEVIAMLNGIRQELLCVRGNCDTEVDQMVLEFPILADYAWFYVPVGAGEEKRTCMMFATHGHVFHEGHLPMLKAGDILLNGHTHVPACREHSEYIYMNPGSVSIPKEGSWHGYMICQDGCFIWKDLSGTEQMRYER